MALVMVRDGKFEATLARTAIEEARRSGFGHLPAAPAPQPLPEIDTSANRFRVPDREINILFSLRVPRIVDSPGFGGDRADILANALLYSLDYDSSVTEELPSILADRGYSPDNPALIARP